MTVCGMCDPLYVYRPLYPVPSMDGHMQRRDSSTLGKACVNNFQFRDQSFFFPDIKVFSTVCRQQTG